MAAPMDDNREAREQPARPALRLFIPPEARYGSYVRRRVTGFAVDLRASETDVEEFVTAVSEAFANALEHSRSQDLIEIRCWAVGRSQMLATVTDRGVGFAAKIDPSEPRLPDPLAERGRGLPLMRRLTDQLDVRSTPGKGTAVTLGRFVRRYGAGSPPGD